MMKRILTHSLDVMANARTYYKRHTSVSLCAFVSSDLDIELWNTTESVTDILKHCNTRRRILIQVRGHGGRREPGEVNRNGVKYTLCHD